MPWSGQHTGKSKKKSGHGFSIGGGLENLWDDVKELRGIPAGTIHIGKALAHDAGKVVGLSHGAYQMDDIGRGIAQSYEDMYSPLVHGDFRKFGRNVYAHPLGPILDAATLFTGGAGAVAKGAELALKAGATGRLARAAAYTAGLEGVSANVPLSVRVGAREVRGRGGKVYRAKSYGIHNTAGEIVHEIQLPRNPVVRARKVGKEKLYARTARDGSYFHPDVRGPRLSEVAPNKIARRAEQALEIATRRALKPLNKSQRDAVFFIAHGINTEPRIKAMLTYRANRLKEIQQNLSEGKHSKSIEHDKLTQKHLIEDVEALQKAIPYIVKKDKHVEEALDAIDAAQSFTNSVYEKRLIRAGDSPEDAATAIRSRQELALREIGVTPEEGERLVTITHHVVKKRGRNLPSGTAGLVDPHNPEALKNQAVNFLNARYARDPSLVIQSAKRANVSEQVFMRMQRAMASAVPFDPKLHAKGLSDGTLRRLTPNTREFKDLQDAVDFLEEKLKPALDSYSSPDLEAIESMLNDAIIASKAKGLVFPEASYRELSRQARDSVKLITKLNNAVIGQWRHIVLSLKGTFYVNNFIGNLVIGMLSHPIAYPRALVRESLGPARSKFSKRIGEVAPDLERGGGARVLTGAESKQARYDLLGRLGTGVASKMALITEDNFRRAAFRVNYNKLAKRVQANAKQMSGKKLSRDELADLIMNDKHAVQELAEASFGDLLDYSKLSPFERDYLIPFYPFWAFTRSMAGRTIRLTLDEPWKMKVLELWGHVGIEATEDEVGGTLPDYLRGIILGKDLGDGKHRGLLTYGMNPFTSPIDTMGQALSLVGVEGEDGGTNPVAGINPLIKSALEAAFKRDTFYGQDLYGTRGDILKRQLAMNLPPYQLYQKLAYPSQFPTMERTPKELLLGYNGIPVGTLNYGNAKRAMAYNEMKRVRDKRKNDKMLARREARRRDVNLGSVFDHG